MRGDNSLTHPPENGIFLSIPLRRQRSGKTAQGHIDYTRISIISRADDYIETRKMVLMR
ncbi:MAG: hypothetical protein KAT07_07785 [Calditrichia bacterium]|nr:hypothetical protein [Calditrichia bacterium]